MIQPTPPPEKEPEPPAYELKECQNCHGEKVALDKRTAKLDLIVLVCPSCDAIPV